MSERALQCAYCTPGFVLSVKALLDEIPNPSDEEIREYLSETFAVVLATRISCARPG